MKTAIIPASSLSSRTLRAEDYVDPGAKEHKAAAKREAHLLKVFARAPLRDLNKESVRKLIDVLQEELKLRC